MSAENQHSFRGLRAHAQETAYSDRRSFDALIPSWVELTRSSAHGIVLILSASRRFSMIPGDSSESYWLTRLLNFQNRISRIQADSQHDLKNLSTSYWSWIDSKYRKSLIPAVDGPSRFSKWKWNFWRFSGFRAFWRFAQNWRMMKVFWI